MAGIILILAFVTQAAFAIYCVATRSNHVKVRSLLRIGAFAAFVLFTLVTVIQWSFRWYLLAALLFVWAALGAWTLVRRSPEEKGLSVVRKLIMSVAMLLLVFIAVTPELIFPQYTLPKVTGRHAVATVNYTYTDTNRLETFTKTGEHRKVNVEFWYPKDGGGKYPLVVFSHGSFGTKTSNTSTFIELASNGYVVCSIDHPYHSLFTTDDQGHLVTFNQSYYQEVVDANAGKYDEATVFKLEHKWMNLRIDDINFVLDTILAQAHKADSAAVYQLVNAEKIGLMGHSIGGVSSAQVARERNDVGAVVNLDADLFGEYLDYVNDKYVMNDSAYPVPILTILGDDMLRGIALVPNANNVIALKRVNATAPHAFEVDITGTNHLSFTDLPLQSPFIVFLMTASVPKAGGGESADKLAVVEKMNALVLQFFNDSLKGEGGFTTGPTY